MKVIGIIPSRYNSSRFPGKALAIIEGKAMLERVYEQAAKSNLSEIIIATDDERIFSYAKNFGANVVMTNINHVSGTDRCYEAYLNSNIKADYVLNIQGDEPFLNPIQINELLEVCNGQTELATQMIKCNSHEILFDTGEVKIVLNKNNEALYFSRSVIPFLKNVEQKNWHLHHPYFRHVGMYVYRTDILSEISKLNPSKLEMAESLEQLRWLENGFKIKCVETQYDSHCIDTPEDIEKVLSIMKKTH